MYLRKQKKYTKKKIIKSLFGYAIEATQYENSQDEINILKRSKTGISTITIFFLFLCTRNHQQSKRRDPGEMIKIHGKRIDIFRFADGIAIITDLE